MEKLTKNDIGKIEILDCPDCDARGFIKKTSSKINFDTDDVTYKFKVCESCKGSGCLIAKYIN